MFLHTLLTIWCLLLIGCASAPTVRPGAVPDSPDPVKLPGSAAVGDRVTVDETAYTVTSLYTAASGRACRRLVNNDGTNRIACRNERGQWYLRDVLAPTRLSAMPPASVSAGEVVPLTLLPTEHARKTAIGSPSGNASADSAAEPSVVIVQQGETLWALARRVTGNALNWRRIAEHNHIVDAASVTKGQRLLIPADLMVSAAGS